MTYILPAGAGKSKASLLDVESRVGNMARKVLYAQSDELLSERIADEFFAVLEARVGRRTVVALPGGRSIRLVLKAVQARAAERHHELWSAVHFFVVDERFVARDHPESNSGQLQTEFFAAMIERGYLKAAQVHLVPVDGSPQEVCRKYEEELARCGSQLHVVFLGAGEDGHIAGLFPGHRLLDSERAGFAYLPDSPKPPAERITALPRLITAAETGFLLFLGSGKSEAYDRFRAADTPVPWCPAKIAVGIPNLFIVTDIASEEGQS